MEELEKNMYFGATPQTLKKAKLLRSKTTQAETILWERLKGKQVNELRFRRQYPINIYIVDFYYHSQKLVIELDGGIHKTQIEYDNERTKDLEMYGLKVIRFNNYEVEKNIELVISKIMDSCS
jgi:very-short-patch-repair endonuclease